MTGLRRRSARAVPSVLVALFCAVLAACPAAAAPAWESSGAHGLAVTSAYHVDVAAAASRSESPVGSQHNTPVSDVCDGIACDAAVSGSVAVRQLGSAEWAEALGPLPGVRAPPFGMTT